LLRKLIVQFIYDLKDGLLSELTHKVQADIDLDLFIRDGYINIYFKGNSILKLTERKRNGTYAVDIHPKYLQAMEISDLIDVKSTRSYVNKIPQLKDNILHHGKSSLEIEYEQINKKYSSYLAQIAKHLDVPIDTKQIVISTKKKQRDQITEDWVDRMHKMVGHASILEVMENMDTNPRTLRNAINFLSKRRLDSNMA